MLPLGRLNPLWWVSIAMLLVCLDLLTGPKTEFPLLFVIPVTIAAWYSGARTAVILALTIPLAHLLFMIGLWEYSGSIATLVTVTIVRAAVVVPMALWFARLSEHERELRDRVQKLEGLLPICSFCKKIRNTSGGWERLETYIASRSTATFSHAFCPSCWDTHYGELGAAPAEQQQA